MFTDANKVGHAWDTWSGGHGWGHMIRESYRRHMIRIIIVILRVLHHCPCTFTFLKGCYGLHYSSYVNKNKGQSEGTWEPSWWNQCNPKCLKCKAGSIRDATTCSVRPSNFLLRAYVNKDRTVTQNFCQRCTCKFNFSQNNITTSSLSLVRCMYLGKLGFKVWNEGSSYVYVPKFSFLIDTYHYLSSYAVE